MKKTPSLRTFRSSKLMGYQQRGKMLGRLEHRLSSLQMRHLRCTLLADFVTLVGPNLRQRRTGGLAGCGLHRCRTWTDQRTRRVETG